MIVIVEGPDGCAKSNISKELARRHEFGYFKNRAEWTAFEKDPDYYGNAARFGEPFLLEFLRQNPQNVIFDRAYPSEWVYPKVFGRRCDEDVMRWLDSQHRELGTAIIICRRESYKGLSDDLYPGIIGEEKLDELDALYLGFSQWTECRSMTLFVDDWDLERQVGTIETFLGLGETNGNL